jgi:glycosyltransferase involved in cell wall biosynthesis
MTPAVTWLLPVKNGMPFLPETLASIEAQTCEDYTLLAWDNGSTDSTVEELKKWIPDRIPGKIVTDRPLGLGDSLAQMVLEAETEFCARIDADDVNMPTRLAEQLKFLRKNPNIAIVGSQVIRIDTAGVEHGQYESLPLEHDDIVHRMLYSFVLWHPTVLFRRKAVLVAGNYRNWNPLIEDYDLWMRLAQNHKLANLDRCLLKYRVRLDGATLAAEREGTLGMALQQCFEENSYGLFGCTPEEARRLRSRGSVFKLPVLVKIARHLCATQGGRLEQRLTSESWLRAMNRLVRRRDVVTRLCYLGLNFMKVYARAR